MFKIESKDVNDKLIDKFVDNLVALRLLMKDEILDVLNMTYRELGISTKKEK